MSLCPLRKHVGVSVGSQGYIPIAAMPKGFLVKRTRRTGAVCYRRRGEGCLDQALRAPHCDEEPGRFAVQSFGCNRQTANVRSPVRFWDISGESRFAPSVPSAPSSPQSPQRYRAGIRLGRTLSSGSPFQAESLPELQAGDFRTSESPAAFSASLAEMSVKPGSRPATPGARLGQAEPRGHTRSAPAEKRANRPGEASASPVFGLRIVEDPEMDVKRWSSTSIPLGEFICQLCKERYSDPLTLAQHQCSRIVRVEYRCPDCEKVFSCPANLASHRRWHKPKVARGDAPSSLRAVAVHNANIQHALPASPKAPDSCPGGNISFTCTLCCKKFRRRSYLRKHLAVHSRRSLIQHSRPGTEENNAGLGHAAPKRPFRVSPPPSLRRESPAATITGNTDTYPCRFCGETFFSSPGLTRHINKCHPAETRDVIFLPQRV